MNIPTSFRNLKAKVDDLDVGKLKTVPVDLKILRDVVDNEIAKNKKFKTLKTNVNNLKNKIPDAITFIHINQYNTDKQKLEQKIGNVDKAIPDILGLVTSTILDTKISKVENKIPDTSGIVTTTILTAKTSAINCKIS